MILALMQKQHAEVVGRSEQCLEPNCENIKSTHGVILLSESIIDPTYHKIFHTELSTDPFEWGGIPVRVMRKLGIRIVKEQIWRWYRERGCSDAVVELVFMINNHDSFKYYVKHICEYICGGKWMVQRVPYSQKVVDRLESCATTIRNEFYDIMKNEATKKQMALSDDWRIQHVAMPLVDVSPNCQGKHVDIVVDTH